MPQLEIGDYFIDELLVQSNDDYDGHAGGGGNVESGIDVDFYRNEDRDPQFLVRLGIDIGEEPESHLPYHVRLSLYGAFDVSDDSNGTLVEELIATNAAPILYGIARGIVGQATSQALYGRYILPTVNFIELAKRKVQELQASQKAG